MLLICAGRGGGVGGFVLVDAIGGGDSASLISILDIFVGASMSGAELDEADDVDAAASRWDRFCGLV